MADTLGTIVLMGSGELTATMVELHKALLYPFGPSAGAVFLDTPAGFQLNVDQIAQKAGVYFKQRVNRTLRVASFKSAINQDPLSKEKAFGVLREADYILIGPGSPTYALEHWRQSPIPGLLAAHVEKGGCLVAASAAALTMGRLTLPVYEIYKVGQPLHWVEGLDILGRFGLNLVVFPHWNNAEGGNHDTRHCFMGARRLLELEKLMPPDSQILGLDEHTALIIDLARQHASIQGVGGATIRRSGREWVFGKGDPVPLALLRGEATRDLQSSGHPRKDDGALHSVDTPHTENIWETIHTKAAEIRTAINEGQDPIVGTGLLEMESYIWQVRPDLEEENSVGAAREIFRELLAILLSHLAARPPDRETCLQPMVDALLALRARLRSQKKWEAADAVRDCLAEAGIVVEDTPQGARWQLQQQDP
jgi:peptidase E